MAHLQVPSYLAGKKGLINTSVRLGTGLVKQAIQSSSSSSSSSSKSVSQPLFPPTNEEVNLISYPSSVTVTHKQLPLEKEAENNMIDLSTPPSLSPVSNTTLEEDPEIEQPRADQSSSKKRVDVNREPVHENGKKQKIIPRINTFVQNLAERKQENKVLRFLRAIYDKMPAISEIITPLADELFVSPEFSGVFRMADMFRYTNVVGHLQYVIKIFENRDKLNDSSVTVISERPRHIYESMVKKYSSQEYVDFLIKFITESMVHDHNTVIDICENHHDITFPEDYDREIKSLLEFIHMSF